MGSTTLAAAVPYPGKATQVSHKEVPEVLKYQKQKLKKAESTQKGVNSFIPVSYLALLPLIPMFLCTQQSFHSWVFIRKKCMKGGMWV